LYSVIGLSVVLNLFNVDWMYKGFENYAYITKRSIAFKLISLATLFLLVHKASDYITYGFVQVIALSGSNIVNVFTAKKYVHLYFKGLNLRKHLRSIFVLFSSVVVINVYTNMDSTMLGIISGQKYVGYYAAANKINGVIIGIVTSLGVVLYPRLSYYIKHDLHREFNLLILKSVHMVIMVSIPACVGLFILAPQVINILSGTGFTPAITTMRIQILIILFVGISNLTGIQILLPLGKERDFLVSVLSGACLDFLLNLFLIPHFQQNGAALSSTIAELFVAIVQIYYTRRYIKGKILNMRNVHYIIASVIMSLCVIGIVHMKMGNILTLLIGTLAGTAIYALYNFISQDPIIMEIIRKVNNKFQIK
ncbi:polysaccharide biosynthesis C-terminal domain-containing protein, partial [Ethanoligenens sp.]|uniref:oligosaccharide flippase family protein n=1 Tax=Ethanoligenens sp. TaxID=2099655 RepID=UPI0039E7E442